MARGVVFLLIALGIAATRIPFLHGDAAGLDGDECVLGLMSKHIAEGRDLPVWFYGQRYGFSLFEAGFGAAAFRLCGVSDESLKGAMLAIWLLGLAPVVLLVHSIHGRKAACVAAALMALCPAWALWSMKARGGYLTAWAATNWVIYLVQPATVGRRHEAQMDSRRYEALRFSLAGLGMAITFAAQPLWLPGAAVFALAALRRLRRRPATSALIAGLTVGAVVFVVARMLAVSHQWESDLFSSPDPVSALMHLPRRLWVMFGGAYEYVVAFPPGVCTQIAAWGWCLVLALALVVGWKDTAASTPHGEPSAGEWAGPALRRTCAAVIAVSLVGMAFFNEQQFAYRYLLPLPEYAALFAVSWSVDAWDRGPRPRAGVIAGVSALLAFGAGAIMELRSVARITVLSGGATTTRSEIAQLIEALESRGLTRVYVLNPLAQWHLMFESQERVIARWKDPVDRVSRYPQAVNEAAGRGDPTALVGDHCRVDEFNASLAASEYPGPFAEPATASFFILPSPGQPLLRALGFEFRSAQGRDEETTPHPRTNRK